MSGEGVITDDLGSTSSKENQRRQADSWAGHCFQKTGSFKKQ